MRRSLTLAVCSALSLAVLPAAQAIDTGPVAGRDLTNRATSVGPTTYMDYDTTSFFYYTTDTTSDCGGNPSCDLNLSQYYVFKDDTASLIVEAFTVGATDPSMAQSGVGGLSTLFDVDSDPTTWDLRIRTVASVYPEGEWLTSPVERNVKGKWVATDNVGFYKRQADHWGLYFDYASLGIQVASMAVSAVDPQGNEDMSPGNWGTPFIPIAALVAGAPGQPQNLKAKAGMESVALSWAAPKNTGASPVTGYTVTASPGGATCTATTPAGCTVTGLVGREDYSFTVTATNAQGTGPASDPVEATPRSPYPQAPEITREDYKGNGQVRDVVLAWTKPAGATGFEVRWDLNGTPWTAWKKTKAKTITIKGLKWDKFTHFEVRAVNAKGAGPVASRLLYFGPK